MPLTLEIPAPSALQRPGRGRDADGARGSGAGPDRAGHAGRPRYARAGRSAPARSRRPGRAPAGTRARPRPGAAGLLAADTGFSFADPFAVGVLSIGSPCSPRSARSPHQRERAFSASLIYLGLGASPPSRSHVGVGWIDPIADAELIGHLTEAAVVIALFSAGLKLDRPLTPRDWGTVAGCCWSPCR